MYLLCSNPLGVVGSDFLHSNGLHKMRVKNINKILFIIVCLFIFNFGNTILAFKLSYSIKNDIQNPSCNLQYPVTVAIFQSVQLGHK